MSGLDLYTGKTISHLNPDNFWVQVLVNNSPVVNPVVIDPSAYIGHKCIFGAGVRIGANVHIGDWVTLGENARLLNQYDHVILYEMGSRNSPCAVYIHPLLGIVISTGCRRNVPFVDFRNMVMNTYTDPNLHGMVYISMLSAAVITIQNYIKGLTLEEMKVYQ